MRTRLTIDDDLFDRIRQEAVRTGRPFRDVLNECLRLGLSARRSLRKNAPRFKVEPFATKASPLPWTRRSLTNFSTCSTFRHSSVRVEEPALGIPARRICISIFLARAVHGILLTHEQDRRD